MFVSSDKFRFAAVFSPSAVIPASVKPTRYWCFRCKNCCNNSTKFLIGYYYTSNFEFVTTEVIFSLYLLSEIICGVLGADNYISPLLLVWGKNLIPKRPY